jgi:hypothetical protein
MELRFYANKREKMGHSIAELKIFLKRIRSSISKPGSNILKAMASSRNGMIPTKRTDPGSRITKNGIYRRQILHSGPDCLRDATEYVPGLHGD